MENSKKIMLCDFLRVAEENNYEVFTKDEVAEYYKSGIMKSRAGELSDAEKEEFTTDVTNLRKAVCVNENGEEEVMYFRKSQVNWEVAEDGTIMKGVAGVYADTAENRKLGRVGEAYIPAPDIIKSMDEESDIMKAMRTGRYADTAENRRLHRVGQPYKKRAGKEGGDGEDGNKNEAGWDKGNKVGNSNKEVTYNLGDEDFSTWDSDKENWQADAKKYNVQISKGKNGSVNIKGSKKNIMAFMGSMDDDFEDVNPDEYGTQVKENDETEKVSKKVWEKDFNDKVEKLKENTPNNSSIEWREGLFKLYNEFVKDGKTLSGGRMSPDKMGMMGNLSNYMDASQAVKADYYVAERLKGKSSKEANEIAEQKFKQKHG